MAGTELGPWDPMRPNEAAAEFGPWKVPWWIAGGWAIDLMLGYQSREHGDLDVLVLRRDQALVREYLSEWDIHAADPPGSLRQWPVGETLPPTVHDVWCRRTPSSPWAFQLMIDDTDNDDWLFRRDSRVRRSISRSPDGRARSATQFSRRMFSSSTKAKASARRTSPTSVRCSRAFLLVSVTGCGQPWRPCRLGTRGFRNSATQ